MSLLFNTERLPSRYAEAEGEKYLWFSGTDYLAMGYNPILLSLLSRGFAKLGSHYGGSRNNTLQIAAFREAETTLSRFTGAEDALLVSSGMLAGFMLRSQLLPILQNLRPGFRFEEIEAPMLHPALSRKSQSQSDWSEWAVITAKKIQKRESALYHILYSDAMGTPQTTRFKFTELTGLRDTLVVVDDSHGLGVLGLEGRGSYKELKDAGIGDLLVIASLNKAMGIPGGVILGSSEILNALRQTTIFTGASPMPPVYANALMQMINRKVYQHSHSLLMKNNDYFFGKLTVRDCFLHASGYPVYTSSDPGLFSYLQSKKILTSSFHYPAKDDPLMTRIVITPAHLPEDLDLLAKLCGAYFGA